MSDPMTSILAVFLPLVVLFVALPCRVFGNLDHRSVFRRPRTLVAALSVLGGVATLLAFVPLVKEAPEVPLINEAKVLPTQESADALQAVLKLKTDSYHVFLREASVLLTPVLLRREWSEVQKLMKSNSFVLISAEEYGTAVKSQHLLKSKAITFPNGHSLNLCLFLAADNLNQPNLPARPGKLYATQVALVAYLDAPYPQVIREQRFPKGSVLDAMLRCEKVKEVGELWPLLHRMYIHYGYIPHKWRLLNPRGFHVYMEFIAPAEEGIARKPMFSSVASGLDPLQSSDGSEKALKGFKLQDSLGDFEPWGGLEWWPLSEAAVNAIKRKYFKVR